MPFPPFGSQPPTTFSGAAGGAPVNQSMPQMMGRPQDGVVPQQGNMNLIDPRILALVQGRTQQTQPVPQPQSQGGFTPMGGAGPTFGPMHQALVSAFQNHLGQQNNAQPNLLDFTHNPQQARQQYGMGPFAGMASGQVNPDGSTGHPYGYQKLALTPSARDFTEALSLMPPGPEANALLAQFNANNYTPNSAAALLAQARGLAPPGAAPAALPPANPYLNQAAYNPFLYNFGNIGGDGGDGSGGSAGGGSGGGGAAGAGGGDSGGDGGAAP